MMDRLREGVNGIAIKIILGIIILSFVFTGVSGYLGGGNSNVVAEVGNVKIEQGAFEQVYQNERNRMQSQMGDYFSTLISDPQYLQTFRRSVLDRMINDVLLEQYAQTLGLRVSDDQVSELILSMPQFQTNGKFDQDIYAATLRRAGFSPDSFAEYLRKDLLRNQVITAVQESEFTLKNEVEQQIQLLTQTRDIQTITLNIDDFAQKAQVTDEELQAYYQSHSENYERPEQMKVAYIELSAEQLKDTITVTDEEAKSYYQEHLDKYSTQEQRKVRHILIKDDEARAEEILAQLKDGADFAAFAEKNSDDIGSARQGGDLGWIEKGVMDPVFEKAAFELTSKGDISNVVKSDFGYHIIQLEDVKTPQAEPYEQVVAEIKSEIRDQKAIDEFYKLQSELESVAFESPDSLDEAAKVIGQKIQTTDFISQMDAPEILKNSVVAQALESSDVKRDGMNSEVLEVAPEHVIVVRVNDVRDEITLPLEEVKEQVTAQLLATKGEQSALELASSTVESLQKGNEKVLTDNGLVFDSEKNIDRRSPFANDVFAMPRPSEGKATYSQTRDDQGNVVIVKLNKVSTSDSDEQFEQQIASQLLRMNNQQDLDVLLSSLRESISVEYKTQIEQ